MTKKYNTYQNTADFYDYDPRPIIQDDIKFYQRYAKRQKGPILELACGTGRITVPLALENKNQTITALDISDSMLEKLKVKIRENEIKNIEIIKADMSDFNLNKKFSLIFIPFRSFQALTEQTKIENCLLSVKSHLADYGKFILDVFRPDNNLDESWCSGEMIQWEINDEKNQRIIKKGDIRKKIDTVKQIIYTDLFYYVETGSARHKVVDSLKLKYYYQAQIEELLKKHFYICEAYGYYDTSKINEGSELIYVCCKLGLRTTHFFKG